MNNLIWALIGLILGALLDIIIAKIANGKIFGRKKKQIYISKQRIHHSSFGIIFFIIGLFNLPYFWISLGIGIILSHTIRTKEFVFIEKRS